MQISVYDTYVQRPDGRRMHFDILVPAARKDIETVLGFGRTYRATKGLTSTEKCCYCRMESAEPLVEVALARTGLSILELKNCE
jgi:hypothetical protein